MTLINKVMFIAPIIVCLVILNGCAASSTSSSMVELIEEPTGSMDRALWLVYYQQQFEKYGDNVLPPRDKEPNVARQAYVEAKTQWQEKQPGRDTTLLMLGVFAVLGLFIYGMMR